MSEEFNKNNYRLFLEKEIKDLESTDDGKKSDVPIPEKPEVDNSKVLTKEQKEDWRKGYTDYEVKNKESDRVVFEDSEIEITEEDLE